MLLAFIILNVLYLLLLVYKILKFPSSFSWFTSKSLGVTVGYKIAGFKTFGSDRGKLNCNIFFYAYFLSYYVKSSHEP